MKIIFYENQPEKLFPLTLTHPAFDILSAGTTLYKICIQQFKPVKIDFIVRDYLQKTTALNYKPNRAPDNNILFLDSALVPSYDQANHLAQIVKTQKNIIIKNNARIIGAYFNLKLLDRHQQKIIRLILSHRECHSRESGNPEIPIADHFSQLKLKSITLTWPTLFHLHDIILTNLNLLKENLEYLKPNFTERSPGVFLSRQVNISPNVVFDTRNGPIIISDRATISHFVYLAGPLYIGQNSLIKEFASLKHSTIGDHCKIGGEIHSSVMDNYSNKQHYGFLGNSYMGQWTNLAAGATTSNLKNTYGAVTMNGINTNEQFLGCIMVDYSKAAINTSLLTGKVIGVNSHVYGQVITDVPSFTNYINSPDRQTEFRLDKAIQIQSAMFQRRGLRPAPAHRQLLTDIFNLTKPDRQRLRIKPGKLTFG